MRQHTSTQSFASLVHFFGPREGALLPRPGSALGFSALAAVSVSAVFFHIRLRLVPRRQLPQALSCCAAAATVDQGQLARIAEGGLFTATHGFQRASLLSSLLACLTAAGASLSLLALGSLLAASLACLLRAAIAASLKESQLPRKPAAKEALRSLRELLTKARACSALALCIAGRIAGPSQTRFSALSLSAAAHRISALSFLSFQASLGLVSCKLSLFN
jgi:hypothetical protein